MHRAPMWTPFVSLRMTAYHRVVASPDPWMRNHGGGGPSTGSAVPLSANWRPVAI